jgi:hypothetical protein
MKVLRCNSSSSEGGTLAAGADAAGARNGLLRQERRSLDSRRHSARNTGDGLRSGFDRQRIRSPIMDPE